MYVTVHRSCHSVVLAESDGIPADQAAQDIATAISADVETAPGAPMVYSAVGAYLRHGGCPAAVRYLEDVSRLLAGRS